MTRDELYDELVGQGYSGAIEDILVQVYGTADINTHIYTNINQNAGGLDNLIQISSNSSELGIAVPEGAATTEAGDPWLTEGGSPINAE